MNQLLETELTAFLEYGKYDRIGINSGNSRNGVYGRKLHTATKHELMRLIRVSYEYGDLQLKIARDRNGGSKQQTIAPYKAIK